VLHTGPVHYLQNYYRTAKVHFMLVLTKINMLSVFFLKHYVVSVAVNLIHVNWYDFLLHFFQEIYKHLGPQFHEELQRHNLPSFMVPYFGLYW
jgi:hypothetical protein